MRRARLSASHTKGLLSFAVALVLLVSSAQLGIRTGALRGFPGFTPDRKLDYSAVPGGYPELSEDFVLGQLGPGIAPERRLALLLEPPTPRRPTRIFGPSEASFPPGFLGAPSEPGKDGFAQATPVPVLPFDADSPDAGARESTEPAGCSDYPGTVWFRYTPVRSVGLFANTYGSQSPVALAVYAGSQLARLQSVGCDASGTGNAAVTFPAEGGTTYYFQLARPDSGRGIFALDVQGTTALVSRTATGDPVTGLAGNPALSANGRFVAFNSEAADVTPDQSPTCVPTVTFGTPPAPRRCLQIFVHDRVRNTTRLASARTPGGQGDDHSVDAALSPDGRYIVFTSWARNLVPDDTNLTADTFMRDLETGATRRVSLTADGTQISGEPRYPWRTAVAGGGTHVVFASNAPELAKAGAPKTCLASPPGIFVGLPAASLCQQIYVRNMVTGGVTLATRGLDGLGGDGDSFVSSITPGGRFVAYTSSAANLVPDDENGQRDMFVTDVVTGRTTRVSVDSEGEENYASSDNYTQGNALSADGRYVVFLTGGGLVQQDDNATMDTYVHDLRTHRTTLVSVSSHGDISDTAPGVAAPIVGALSADGRYVAFESGADNLVPDDTNGVPDVFVRDMRTFTTIRVSVRTDGTQCNRSCHGPSISADGTVVMFQGQGLVAGDDPLTDVPSAPVGNPHYDKVYAHIRHLV